jgi:predicted oxidoreductase (fatty acid repression mutant protein)
MSPSITADQWLAAAKHRRSVYGLKDTSHVSDERIQEIISNVLSFTPSSYNTQPARITLVLGEKHKQLWDVVIETAEPILKGFGPGVWDAMGPRFQAFKNAYGSVCDFMHLTVNLRLTRDDGSGLVLGQRRRHQVSPADSSVGRSHV